MLTEIVGRDEELAAVRAFLDGIEEGPAALLLEGEAGIGKTTVWTAGIRDAVNRAHAHAVLVARPAGAETQISFAALGDLLETVDAAAFAALPPPQRRALEIALALVDARGSVPDPHAIAMAFLNVLRSLATSSHVLLALDDVQWLDSPSADVLAFAVRRLRHEPVRLLATLRVEPRVSLPLELDRALPEERLQRLDIGPVSLGALHQLVRTRLGVVLARPTLHRLREYSGGNPFYALEIARALRPQDEGAELARDAPLPDNLLELVRARLALPAETQDALLAVAMLADPTEPMIEQVVEAPAPLEPALEAQVIELERERVRFTHPLLASAAIAAVPQARKRLLHRRLAEFVEDAEERAWHAALGAELPDERVAALVEAAARNADARGAPGRAAELAERASGLTPEADPESGWRRSLVAGEYHLKSGNIKRARIVLGPLSDMVPAGPLRASALSVLADCYEDSFEAASEFLSRAVDEAGDDAALLAEIIWKQAILSWAIGSFATAAERFGSAAELAEQAEDERLLVLALSGSVFADFYMGRHDAGRLRRALAIEEAVGGCRIAFGPNLINGFVLLAEGRLGEARRELERLLRRADEEGDEYARVMVLQLLSHIEWCAGKPQRAAALAVEALTGADPTHYASLHRKARAEATLGDLATAHVDAENALELAEQAKDAIHTAHARGVLGFVGLSSGDVEAAHRHLDVVSDRLLAMGVGEPAIFPFFPDAIEALIEVGDLERAETLLRWLEDRGRTLGRTWALATGARCRALLAAATGDEASALAVFDEALVHHERLPFPFERGRTLLGLGQTRRRAKQKRAAREALEAALAIFEEVGAPLWAEKARVELGRIGGRSVPQRGALTATEQAIAELVAAGGTNEEVAAALSLSPRTVQWNLSKIYRKVGVRSRTELAAALAGAEKARES